MTLADDLAAELEDKPAGDGHRERPERQHGFDAEKPLHEGDEPRRQRRRVGVTELQLAAERHGDEQARVGRRFRDERHQRPQQRVHREPDEDEARWVGTQRLDEDRGFERPRSGPLRRRAHQMTAIFRCASSTGVKLRR